MPVPVVIMKIKSDHMYPIANDHFLTLVGMTNDELQSICSVSVLLFMLLVFHRLDVANFLSVYINALRYVVIVVVVTYRCRSPTCSTRTRVMSKSGLLYDCVVHMAIHYDEKKLMPRRYVVVIQPIGVVQDPVVAAHCMPVPCIGI